MMKDSNFYTRECPSHWSHLSQVMINAVLSLIPNPIYHVLRIHTSWSMGYHTAKYSQITQPNNSFSQITQPNNSLLFAPFPNTTPFHTINFINTTHCSTFFNLQNAQWQHFHRYSQKSRHRHTTSEAKVQGTSVNMRSTYPDLQPFNDNTESCTNDQPTWSERQGFTHTLLCESVNGPAMHCTCCASCTSGRVSWSYVVGREGETLCQCECEW